MKNPSVKTVTLAAAIGLTACTLVLDLDTKQCTSASDCVARGPSFEGMVCLNGSCQRPTAQTTSPATSDDKKQEAGVPAEYGTDANTGQSDTGVTDSVAETTADRAAVVEGGTDSESSDASSPGCVSTAQCVQDNLDEPYVCLRKGDPCLRLKSTECPLVFGEPSDTAVYFGAFLNLPAASPLSQMSTLNVQLAIEEFNGSVGGLPGGPLGKLRPLVAIVCRNDPAYVDVAADHLIGEIGIPAAIVNLPSADLKAFVVNHALPANLFVINPGFADNSLTSLASGGLVWHMIGDIRDVGPTYTPLLARIERFLDESPDGGGGTHAPLRVAMVVVKRYAEQSIADKVISTLRFNGKSVTDNGPNFFTTSVTALADDPEADYASVNRDLLLFRPDVIIAITREEFVYKMLPAIEGGWKTGPGAPRRPFYIVPTALSGNLDLVNYIGLDSDGTSSEDKRQRFAGVAPASAEDMTLYDDFLIRFRTEYAHFQNPGGFENFYDAVYLLANAMFAAGSPPMLTGADVARGMQRVTSGSTPIDVGPTHIADGFAALATGGNVRINGTMGPADFDPGTGARHGNGSVYCYNRVSGLVSIAYDVLRYDRSTGTLRGEFPCVDGF